EGGGGEPRQPRGDATRRPAPKGEASHERGEDDRDEGARDSESGHREAEPHHLENEAAEPGDEEEPEQPAPPHSPPKLSPSVSRRPTLGGFNGGTRAWPGRRRGRCRSRSVRSRGSFRRLAMSFRGSSGEPARRGARAGLRVASSAPRA